MGFLKTLLRRPPPIWRRRRSPRPGLTWLWLFLGLLLAGVAPPPVWAGESAQRLTVSREDALAGYLLHCIRFGTWPEFANPYAERVVRIGLVNDEGIGHSLDRLIEKTRATWFPGVELRIIRTDHPARLRTCHIVFLGGGSAADTDAILAELTGRPILLVSDRPGFLERGGVTEVRLESGELSFGINLDQLGTRQLELQAKMKDLAVEIFKNGRRDRNPRHSVRP